MALCQIAPTWFSRSTCHISLPCSLPVSNQFLLPSGFPLGLATETSWQEIREKREQCISPPGFLPARACWAGCVLLFLSKHLPLPECLLPGSRRVSLSESLCSEMVIPQLPLVVIAISFVVPLIQTS